MLPTFPTQAEQVKALVDQVFTSPNVPAALTALQALKASINTIEIALAVEGRALQGLSYAELAKALGITRQSLAERLGQMDALGKFGLSEETLNALRQTGAKPGSTTVPGYVNRHGQRVVRRTNLPGNDHLQRIYVLVCTTCGHEYGANGSDIHIRKCPSHQGGAPGLAY